MKLPNLLESLALNGYATEIDLRLLDEDDWLFLAAVATAASAFVAASSVILTPPSDIRFLDADGNVLRLYTLTKKSEVATGCCALTFEGTEYCVSSETSVTAPTVFDPVVLIHAIAAARDRVDALLFLPREMRDRRITALAKAIGITPTVLRNVATVLPGLERAYLKTA